MSLRYATIIALLYLYEQEGSDFSDRLRNEAWMIANGYDTAGFEDVTMCDLTTAALLRILLGKSDDSQGLAALVCTLKHVS